MIHSIKREITFIKGKVGKIQITCDLPSSKPRGIILISHPQPLLGGNPNHIVPYTLAKKLSTEGWLTVRPSFRGVEGTDGVYSDGVGETEDMLEVVTYLEQEYPQLTIGMVGFSFGAYVFARTAQASMYKSRLDETVNLKK